MTRVQVERATKTYPADETGGKPIMALDDVSLTIEDGEAVVIVGPSGCGKTTLLRVIAGLEAPNTGQVFYDGTLLGNIEAIDRVVGMVFQDYALIPHWNAEKNVGFFLRLRKREQEVPERVKRVSQITGVDINKLMERMPRQLSGGEKQRIAIARAFARDMQLLLFDEPFANLDAQFRTGARVALKRLLGAFPVTTVMVTHEQTEASSIGQRIILMNDGRIAQMGSYDDLYGDPRDVFVAQFIGSPPMNLFPGVVRAGRWQGEDFGGFAVPTATLARELLDDTAVVLGVRAEHIDLSNIQDAAGADDGIVATVDEVMPYFAERFQMLTVRRGGREWQVQAPFDAQIKPGEQVVCQLQADKLYFFDGVTGQRL